MPRNIGEGFRRFGPAEIAHFLNIALGSLEESKINLVDGIDRKYFTAAACAKAFQLAKRCDKATLNFRKSLQPFIRTKRSNKLSQPLQLRMPQKLRAPGKREKSTARDLTDPSNLQDPSDPKGP